MINNMSAKEKAKELFDKYCYAIRTEENGSGYYTNVIYAKQCALIAVDEMLDFRNNLYINEGSLAHKYLLDIKHEIEKL
jgi:hypothetical protein